MKGSSMNSHMKDALTEFINNNSSAIDQAIENGNQDLSKDGPVISDLVSYLSCPTPQSSHKEAEPMSTNEKSVFGHAYHSLELQQITPQQSHHFNSAQQEMPESNHFSSTQMCASSSSSYSSDLPLLHESLPQHDHLDSFERSRSPMFPEAGLHSSSQTHTFQGAEMSSSAVFEGSGAASMASNSDVHGPGDTGTNSQPQFCHSGQSVQFQVTSSTSQQYQQNTHSQLLGKEDYSTQFHSQTPVTPDNHYSDSSVVVNFATSINSGISFHCNESGLPFSLINVSAAPMNNIDMTNGQFRAPEKMHIDEPENVYQSAVKRSVDQFQPVAGHNTDPADVHMQSCSAPSFHAQSPLEAVPTSLVVTIQNDQSLTSLADLRTSNDFGVSSVVSPGATPRLSTFDVSRETYQQPVTSIASSFSPHSFPQNSSRLQAHSGLDFQKQQQSDLHQVEDLTHFLPQPDTSLVTSYSHPLQQNCSSSQSHNSPYQADHYLDSPAHCNTSPMTSNSFHKSIVHSDSSASLQECNQHSPHLHGGHADSPHYQHRSPASLQATQVEMSQFQQNHVLDAGYNSDSSLVQHSDLQPVNFQSSMDSELPNSVLFSQSAQTNTAPSSQVSNSSAFVSFSSSAGIPLQAGRATTTDQTRASQTAADFKMLNSANQGKISSESAKSPSDVTMQDVSSLGNVSASVHPEFSEGSFSHLDIVAMVNSLHAESQNTPVSSNEPVITCVSYDQNLSGYNFNDMTPVAETFSGVHHPVPEAHVSYSFTENLQAVSSMNSSNPPMLAPSFSSDSSGHNNGSPFVDGQNGGGQFLKGQNSSSSQFSDGQSNNSQFLDDHNNSNQFGGNQNNGKHFGIDQTTGSQFGIGQNNDIQFGSGQNNDIQFGSGQNNDIQFGSGQNNDIQFGSGQNNDIQFGGRQNTSSQFDGSRNTGSQYAGASFSSSPQVASENSPQPMQIQDSESQSSSSFHNSPGCEGRMTSNETAMDVSAGLGEKGGGSISSGISYEEIHRSIVKAGNELSSVTGDPLIVNQSVLFEGTSVQTASADSLCSVADMYPASVASMFPVEKSDIGSGTYSVTPQEMILTSAMVTSGQQGGSFSGETNLPGTSHSAPVGVNLLSGIIGNLQAATVSTDQLLLQGHLAQQVPVTVPNFLENPGSISSHLHLNQTENLLSSTTPTSFAAAVSLADQDTLTINSIMGQSSLLGLHKTGLVTSQQTVMSSLSSASAHTEESHMFSSVGNLPQPGSFLTQLVSDTCDKTSSGYSHSTASQVSQSSDLPTTGSSVSAQSGSSSGVFLQFSNAKTDGKISTLFSTPSHNIKLNTSPALTQKSGTMTLSGPASLPASAGNTSLGSATKQPHIIVSLEELQKLLAEQNLSQPAPPSHSQQQQPYTTLASPQTLVLQKHASHSLKQSQPRLFIRGSSFSTNPRLGQPHQQAQPNRERLQLLTHQGMSPSDQASPGVQSQKSSDSAGFSTSQENRQKSSNPFQFVSISQADQLPQKLFLFQQSAADQPPRMQLQLKQTQVVQQQQQTVNLFLQQIPSKSGESKLAPLQLIGQQQPPATLSLSQQQSKTEQKTFLLNDSSIQPVLSIGQRGAGASSQSQNVIQLAQMHQELLLMLKQEEKGQEFEELHLHQFLGQHQKTAAPFKEKQEKSDRTCSDTLKKDYKHLHSLLTGETAGVLPSLQTRVLNLPNNLSGQSAGLNLPSGTTLGSPLGTSSAQSFTPANPPKTAPLSFLPLSSLSLQLTKSSSTSPASSVSTLAFSKSHPVSTFSNVSNFSNVKDLKLEASLWANSQSNVLNINFCAKSENNCLPKNESDDTGDHPLGHQAGSQASAERKRCHTPLSVDLNSPGNSSPEAASPLSSPVLCEDGNTQLTLIERSAGLHIKSDSMHGVDDAAEDDENANFDANLFHKRTAEFHSTRGKIDSVPMKIAKPTLGADAHSGVAAPASSDPSFDFGSAVTTASNFSFAFGNQEDTTDVFTFGLSSAVTTSTDTTSYKDGSKNYRVSSARPVMKTVGVRTTVPTQPVRPTSRKQKDYSLKAYYPSKAEGMELKILVQPEPQHRARYQTEGSRGAIKDASQQGFPSVKLFGYNKPAKLQVFIGDECGRVKPHGFYQACRVFGKNSTTCSEQEIEDTTVIEVEMQPENDMTVKLDCVGILKLRNADVERRIGPKRAREKKKTNTRARLILRCLVENSDGSHSVLQVASNPIVCTQPVGQPEICRMSTTESSVVGGDSLFIIGKNFKNKGTIVMFQKLDSNEEQVLWQVEAEIEQEFFQPTHLICKIPAYQDQTVERPELVHIVISCAGKKSDPHHFTYKPVVVPKQEIPMDTDSSFAQSILVSPEAFQLNRMMQLTNAQPVPTTTAKFQLPQSTMISKPEPPVQSSPSSVLSSHLLKPGRLLTQLTSTSCLTSPPQSTPAVTMSMPAPTSGQTLPSFLLDDKSDIKVPVVSAHVQMESDALATISGGNNSNSIAHSQPAANTSPAPSAFALNDSHQASSFTTSSHVISQVTNAGSVNSVSSSSSSSSTLPSKPFFVVVDPTTLQSVVGGDKIQQLLQYILDTQSKMIQ